MEKSFADLTIQLNANERAALLGSLGLTPSALSPLAGQVAAASGALVDLAAFDSPDVRKAMKIAATPDLAVRFRIGGGSVDLVEFTLTRCKDQGHALVLVLDLQDQLTLTQLFSGPEPFLAWLTGQYAGKSDQTVANYIPPTVDLGEFIFLLHGIDAFRIASFQSMLDYAPGRQSSIRPGDFYDTMQRSVRSKDIRWLLPAFLLLTPGLDVQGLDLSGDKTAVLVDRGFLNTGRDPVSQESILVFGEAGRNMGVEFYRTWLAGIGFETRVAAPGGVRAVNRGFLAPTALSNHLVLIDPTPGRSVQINHQAMTLDQLQVRLGQLFTEALALETAPPVAPPMASPVAAPVAATASAPVGAIPEAPEAPAASAATSAQPRFCTQCGTPTTPGMKFCTNCGAKL
jgi:hypothetical protein